ncbi:MAG: GNAT family N-acetyltransferase [Pirellulales bacterium]|nr:GNAT family N-acetyltransferase [Pirellulales bacterium]
MRLDLTEHRFHDIDELVEVQMPGRLRNRPLAPAPTRYDVVPATVADAAKKPSYCFVDFCRIAFIEHGIVREQNRRHGLGTTLLQKAIEMAREEGCQCLRCNVSWTNEAEMTLLKKCGFALACIEDGEYLAVKPLQVYSCNE